MELFCCECGKDITARLTSGKECYPHRDNLHDKAVWKCDTCKNFVGCHKGQENKPLGCIPNAAIKKARMHIHDLIDPLWKNGLIKRHKLYSKLAESLGISEYHTANIRSVEEGRDVYRAAIIIRKELLQETV